MVDVIPWEMARLWHPSRIEFGLEEDILSGINLIFSFNWKEKKTKGFTTTVYQSLSYQTDLDMCIVLLF